ncbi:MAG TPA: hypothetical protein VHN11_17730 [Xanthobacteraceae bacterium]|jgi:hypothetical protein|nr:hypothetical protein [Xanthobacteraceae bacterium]
MANHPGTFRIAIQDRAKQLNHNSFMNSTGEYLLRDSDYDR